MCEVRLGEIQEQPWHDYGRCRKGVRWFWQIQEGVRSESWRCRKEWGESGRCRKGWGQNLGDAGRVRWFWEIQEQLWHDSGRCRKGVRWFWEMQEGGEVNLADAGRGWGQNLADKGRGEARIWEMQEGVRWIWEMQEEGEVILADAGRGWGDSVRCRKGWCDSGRCRKGVMWFWQIQEGGEVRIWETQEGRELILSDSGKGVGVRSKTQKAADTCAKYYEVISDDPCTLLFNTLY